MMNEVLSYKRCWFLLRAEWRRIHRPLLLGAVILLLLSMAGFLCLEVISMGHVGILFWYLAALFGGGMVYCSRAFHELKRREDAIFFLMLPCSAIEKLAVKWLQCGLIFPMLLIGQATVTMCMLYDDLTLVQADSGLLLRAWMPYGVLASFFLWGSLCFRRHALLNTILVLVCLTVILVLGAGTVFGALLIAWDRGHGPGSAMVYWSTLKRLMPWSGAAIMLLSVVYGYVRFKRLEIY